MAERERPLVDRLDDAVQAALGRTGAAPDRELQPYVAIARVLLELPRPSFRARLKTDLLRRTNMSAATGATAPTETTAAAMPAREEPRAPVSQTAIPALRVKDVAAAIAFYEAAFGAREVMRFTLGGRIAHAEITIGNSTIALGEEAIDYGFPSAETLGGSPVQMRIYVDDADASIERAVAAGARLLTRVSDQFYGERSGAVSDPFGFRWTLSTRTENLSVEEMHRRMTAEQGQRPPVESVSIPPPGFRTVTPYLVVEDAPGLIAFLTRVFDAEERHRSSGSGGGIHAEMRIGDSMLMIGGGAAGHPLGRPPMPTALHVYVENVDATYRRAIEAGALSIGEPVDQPYGERGGGVKDSSGNVWYIATAHGERHVPAGLHDVNVYLHPRRAEPLIRFLERAFGATGVEKYASPDGVVHHARVTITDSVVEMGEAHGPYQPMPTMFYLYVPNADAAYQRALSAGATSLSEPVDQQYGDRTAGVADIFGNQWYMATPLRPVR